MIDKVWIVTNRKLPKQTINKELVTLRANNTKQKNIMLTISIGTTICDILDFQESKRVNVFIDKKDRNTLLIKKAPSLHTGFKLSFGKHSSFMTVSFTMNFYTEVKIRQTVISDYTLNNDSSLLINLSKIKWEK